MHANCKVHLDICYMEFALYKLIIVIIIIEMIAHSSIKILAFGTQNPHDMINICASTFTGHSPEKLMHCLKWSIITMFLLTSKHVGASHYNLPKHQSHGININFFQGSITITQIHSSIQYLWGHVTHSTNLQTQQQLLQCTHNIVGHNYSWDRECCALVLNIGVLKIFRYSRSNLSIYMY